MAETPHNDLLQFAHALEAGKARALYDPARPVHIARAPGRLDVMGGIADYSGSLVLQWPIREATVAAAQTRTDGAFQATSLGDVDRTVVIPPRDWAALLAGSFEAARAYFAADDARHWAAYVAGPALVLAQAQRRLVDLRQGVTLAIRSAVPEGKGVSSSAAIEVATLRALAAALSVDIEGVALATLAQMAENHIVGAPCGIMDQMASALGREHQLLALLCQPAEVQGYAPLPESLAVWGIDSGIRHAVTGSDYTSVRVGAFMGYRIIADLAGLERDTSAAAPRFVDTAWGGYIANVGPEVFDARYAAQLPETITGAEFLARYGGTTDVVTKVDPARTYSVRQPAAHPIREHDRVTRFQAILNRGAASEADRVALGELMYGSHASYSGCGLGSEGTDRLVAMVREAGPAAGLYGAKITGGGSGGTVAILGRADAGTKVAAIAERYAAESGRTPYLFEGSSPGAVFTPTLEARLAP